MSASQRYPPTYSTALLRRLVDRKNLSWRKELAAAKVAAIPDRRPGAPGNGLADDEGWLPQGPGWVSTPSGEEILSGLRYAQLAREIVIIYGGSGIGKTHALNHFRTLAPNVFYALMSPTTAGLLACLEEIAVAIGITDYARQPGYLYRSICSQLRGSNALLAIDEAQELGIAALDQVRCIHDRLRIGVVLVGTTGVYRQIAGTSKAAPLHQLQSRVGKRIHLARSTPADADALLNAWGFHDRESHLRGRAIASRPGALQTLAKVLRLAVLYAQTDHREPVLEDIEAAWQDLGGLDWAGPGAP